MNNAEIIRLIYAKKIFSKVFTIGGEYMFLKIEIIQF